MALSNDAEPPRTERETEGREREEMLTGEIVFFAYGDVS
jgi:hypothetical protein